MNKSTLQNQNSIKQLFDLTNRVIVITGGAGMLGVQHAEAIAEFGAIPILLDINEEQVVQQAKKISQQFNVEALGLTVDITKKQAVEQALVKILEKYGRLDGLINNAANDPKVTSKNEQKPWSRFENFPQQTWENDLAVGLTGSYICSQVFGSHMASNGRGVILNIASDLAVIAPDQKIYRQEGLPNEQQPTKPVTYSVLKHGLIGLNKYLASFWGERGIRVNAISPGGVYNNQPDDFVKKLTAKIPMGRMAELDEYKGAVVFLLSDSASYVTGANFIIDGGRSCT